MSYIVPRDKPQECGECPYINLCNDCRLIRGSERIRTVEEQYQHCPLIEIPTPHGRLIDGDELKSKFRHGNGDDDADSAWISTIRRFITQAETIIEAEE